MAGICGIDLNTGIINKNDIQNSNKIMKHRGPNFSDVFISDHKKIGFGYTTFGDSKSNNQNFFQNEEYLVIIDGEIYNIEELKKILSNKIKFSNTKISSAEILLLLYTNLKDKCLSYLEGAFSFCIFDKTNNTLFLARDFAGQKPLVYLQHSNNFYFASEIPALLTLCPDYNKEIDYSVLGLYFVKNLSHIPNPFCIFKGIKKLNNASFMIVKNGKIIKEERFSYLQKQPLNSIKNEIEFLYNKLDLMVPQDKSFSAFLSGGIDSSFVCSGLKTKQNKPIDVYTLKVGENDEDFIRAKYIADKLELNQHIITLNNTDFLQSINDSIGILGEPYFHITSIFTDEILKQTKKQHQVIFSGGGGDECYYGYNNLPLILMDIFFIFKKIIPNFLIKAIDKLTRYKYSVILNSTKDSFKENFFIQGFKSISNIFQSKDLGLKVHRKIKDLIQNFKTFVMYQSYTDFSYMFGLFIENMHSLTIQSDLIGMKNSIEIRNPFLEKSVIERAYSIPLRKKISLLKIKEGKEVLKKQLIKLFGKQFLYSKKIGFGVKYNFKKIFEQQYIDIINQKIEKILQRNVFDKKEIQKIMSDFNTNFFLIMKLYSLEIWFEKFID